MNCNIYFQMRSGEAIQFSEVNRLNAECKFDVLKSVYEPDMCGWYFDGWFVPIGQVEAVEVVEIE